MESISFSSPDFTNGQPIPEKCTYYNANHSPALEWKNLPAGTKSLALIVEDPDAPSKTWIHWVIYDIPVILNGLPLGVKKNEKVADLGTQGTNDFYKKGYDGPCPPPGKPHRYFFNLYALNTLMNLPPGLSSPELLAAIKGHILATGQWMGTYQST